MCDMSNDIHHREELPSKAISEEKRRALSEKAVSGLTDFQF